MNNYKTIFLSDLHIGSTQCNAEMLLSFLKYNESEKLVLVGDIIDLWALSKRIYFPQTHNTIIQKLLKKSRNGTEIIYIPGNHDEPLRDYDNTSFGNIHIKNSYIHTTINDKKFLVIHGDEYDVITLNHKWLSKIGNVGYDLLIDANRLMKWIQKLLNINSTFSLSAYIKNKVKNIVQVISDYEESLVETIQDKNLDGIICGHIHHAEIKVIKDKLYLNCGDFVESHTAIVEHFDGTLELVNWNFT